MQTPLRTGLFLALLAIAPAGLPGMASKAGPPKLEWAVAVFPSGAQFNLEIADTPEARVRGYMFRERVGPGQGMLFVFDRPERRGFWMKNCKVSLDIIWLDRALRVVDIAHDRPPCPAQGECATVQPMRAAAYVLEVAGGTARREGLQGGQQVVILSDPELP